MLLSSWGLEKDMNDIHHQLAAFLSHKKKKVNSFIQLK
jgi:hypothetical protein